MDKIWETNHRKLAIEISIKCDGLCRFRVMATALQPNSKYAERTIEVNDFRKIYISFPESPEKIKFIITPLNEVDKFMVDFKEKPLKTYQVTLSSQIKKFVKFAQQFVACCGYEKANVNGRFFTTADKEFKIKFFPIISDQGRVSTTPARIGHASGIIEVSKSHFDKYTIPMRMAILLHEFAHKYLNPLSNLPISDEIGADINALYIYLGLGYSKVDAIHVFINVFLKAQSEGNMKRIRKIMNYIAKFEKGEIAKVLTS